MAQPRNFFVFLLFIAVIVVLVYHFLLSKPFQNHPDAPRIDFLVQEQGDDGLPLFNDNIDMELLARKTGAYVIEWMSDKDYLRQSLNYGNDLAFQRNVSHFNSTKVKIPANYFEENGQGKYWVRAGVLCDDKMLAVIVSYLGSWIADRTGFLLAENTANSNRVRHAYCVGKFRPFLWAREEKIEELTAETAWYPAEKITMAGIFRFRLPKSFEPVSINFQPIKNYVDKGLGSAGVNFDYMHGFESGRHQITLVMYSVKLEKATNMKTITQEAQKKLKASISKKRLSKDSNTSVETLAGVKALLTNRVYPKGQTKMQTFDLLLEENSPIKHSIAVIHEGLNDFDSEKLDEFLNSIEIANDKAK